MLKRIVETDLRMIEAGRKNMDMRSFAVVARSGTVLAGRPLQSARQNARLGFYEPCSATIF
jgi:hypothetical protein